MNEAELPEDEEEDEVDSEEVTEEVEEEDEGEDEEASLTEVRPFFFFLCLLPFLSSRSQLASEVGNTMLVLCWLLEVDWLQMCRSLAIRWAGPLRKVWQGGRDRCSTLLLSSAFLLLFSLADPLSF